MADSGRQIGFEQLGIGSMLKRNTLSVPPNQREYSWTEREVSDLFHDLAKAISEDAPEYFLGSIVAIPRKPGALEIVDGQQRLATTVILLVAIRDVLRGRAPDKLIVDYIENSFLTTIDPHARERVPRISLNVTDGAFFERRIIQSDLGVQSTAASHDLIDQAAVLAHKHVSQILKSYSEKDHGDILNKWVEFLEHRSIVILLKVPSDVNAYKMFETLNDRGLRTSQSDLVKNYLFGESGDRLPEAQQKWASMKALLESIEDEDITINFLRQMLISMYGYLREPDVYETVQRNARGTTSSLLFMAKLESGAADYVAMLNPEHEKWNLYPSSTRRAIQTLILLRIRPIRPVVLSVIRTFSNKEADRALRMIVNLSVRFLIAGGARSGTVEHGLATTARDISDGGITKENELLTTIDKIVPKNPQFQEAFKVATISQAYLARYYLRSLEMTAKKEPDASFIPNDDQQVINLEHVLPQKPGENWPDFTPEVAAAFYKRLGNMALLLAKNNAELRSGPFEQKKTIYAESPYELTRQIATTAKWTHESIERRQAKMAELAVKTWPVSSK